MGHHRGEAARRRISRGPIIAGVAVLVLAALVVGWFQLRSSIAQDSSAAAQSCPEGDTTLPVTVDPTIAPQLKAAAQTFDTTRTVVRDHCVTVQVTEQDSSAVRAALAAPPGTPWDERLGPRPGLWIPQTTALTRTLPAGIVDGAAKSIASSDVVLAVPKPIADGLIAANASWRDLPRLQNDRNWLPGQGALGLAMPANSDPTLAVAEAVATGIAGGPLTAQSASSPPVVTGLSQLIAAAPQTASTAQALSTLTGNPTGPVHAVALTRHEIDTHPNPAVAAYAPGGPTPVADYPAAVLSGGPDGETSARAASAFADFLRQPGQTKLFTDAGLAATTRDAVPPIDASVAAAVADTVARPRVGVNSTVVVDVSASMLQQMDGSSRLQNVVNALRRRIEGLPDGSQLGLWTYAKNLDGSTPYRIAAQTRPVDAQRKGTLDDVLGTLRATGNRSDNTYPTVQAAYRAAVAGYVPERANSVLLITDGPNDDSSITGKQLIDSITAQPDRPVRVDVLAIGDGRDAAPDGNDTLAAVSQRTGGTLVRATSPAELDAAMQQLLS